MVINFPLKSTLVCLSVSCYGQHGAKMNSELQLPLENKGKVIYWGILQSFGLRNKYQ